MRAPTREVERVKERVKEVERDDPGDRGTNPVTAITFSCDVIYFPAVYNL